MVQIAAALKNDLQVASRVSGKGVYHGIISSHNPTFEAVSEGANAKLVASTIRVQNKEIIYHQTELARVEKLGRHHGISLFTKKIGTYNYFQLFPKEITLQLRDDNVKIPSSEISFQENQEWPLIGFKSKDQAESRLTPWALIKSLLALLGITFEIKFSYSEEGLKAGSQVFCYGVGKLTDQGKLELHNIKFLTGTLSSIKTYLKTKFFKNAMIAGCMGGIFLYSFVYFYRHHKENEFKSLIQQVHEENKDLEANHIVLQSKYKGDFIDAHYPAFKKEMIENVVRCECGKYMKNVVNLPCAHISHCYHCFLTKKIKACNVCNKVISDFFVTSYL